MPILRRIRTIRLCRSNADERPTNCVGVLDGPYGQKKRTRESSEDEPVAWHAKEPTCPVGVWNKGTSMTARWDLRAWLLVG